MEHLVKGFPQPQPQPNNISAQARLRILDFPDPETLEANVSKSSSLARVDLVRRAAESPRQLSGSELDVLRQSYGFPELRARVAASETLEAVSAEHLQQVTEQLDAIGAPLYDEDEKKAIDNALEE
ncbi:hypothetical protein Hte_012028 [Hypoxylon texense]